MSQVEWKLGIEQSKSRPLDNDGGLQCSGTVFDHARSLAFTFCISTFHLSKTHGGIRRSCDMACTYFDIQGCTRIFWHIRYVLTPEV